MKSEHSANQAMQVSATNTVVGKHFRMAGPRPIRTKKKSLFTGLINLFK